jgi:hypothetical protein
VDVQLVFEHYHMVLPSLHSQGLWNFLHTGQFQHNVIIYMGSFIIYGRCEVKDILVDDAKVHIFIWVFVTDLDRVDIYVQVHVLGRWKLRLYFFVCRVLFYLLLFTLRLLELLLVRLVLLH